MLLAAAAGIAADAAAVAAEVAHLLMLLGAARCC